MRTRNRKKRQQFWKIYWIALAVFFTLCILCCYAQAEEICKPAMGVREFHLCRFEKMAALNNAEISRKHSLDIEVAKHQVALDLERASADQVNISSESNSYSESFAQITQEYQNQNVIEVSA